MDCPMLSNRRFPHRIVGLEVTAKLARQAGPRLSPSDSDNQPPSPPRRGRA